MALIADDGWMPWAIVGGYALALLLAMRAGRRTAVSGERRFWWLTSAMMLVLGLNKQLDLQTQLTAFARILAREQGWYEARREVQIWFIAIGGLLALGLGVWLARLTMLAGAAVRVSLVGVLLLCGFVLLRAVSFHHVDVLLGMRVMGRKMQVLLEILGIAITGAGAAVSLLARTTGSRREPG